MPGLTLTNLRNHVYHALQADTDTTPSTVSVDDVINAAGTWIYTAHQWQFRERPPITVPFVADQPYVLLPEDFSAMVAYKMTQGLNFGITFTTPEQVANVRSTSVTVSQQYFWATIVRPPQLSRQTPMPPPRIELWPTPSSDGSNRLTIWYRAGWTLLLEADDVANVPDYMELLLIEACRRLAAGWFERLLEPKGGAFALLDELRTGTVWEDAAGEDGLIQTDYGPIAGGAIQLFYPVFTWRSASQSPVANPS